MFCSIGRFLYRIACRLKLLKKGNSQVTKDLRQLYPDKEINELCTEYYAKKIAFSLKICLAGLILGCAVSVNAEKESVLKDGEVTRGTYNEEPQELEILAVLESGVEAFEVTIQPCELREEEAQALYEEFVAQLPSLILGNNPSLQNVCVDLELTEEYENYPFCVEWKSNRPDIVTSAGSVTAVEESTEVELQAIVKYNDWIWNSSLFVCVSPQVLSEAEERRKALEELLLISEQETRMEKVWRLPEEFDSDSIVWQQKTIGGGRILIIGAFLTALLVFVLKDKDLHDELMLKRECLKQQYPDIVQKLVLYMGAGLTMRGAFEKIAPEYEEIQYVQRELQKGISEKEAYEHLGKRVGVQEYLRLSTLLIQNLKKGNATLLQRLKEEAERAAVERLQKSKTMAEEATTKLLVPMVLFLVVVMVMVMLPAFSSMGIS